MAPTTVRDHSHRLLLGTAQFGLDYGLTNKGGRVDPGEIGRILGLASEAGIACLDTAAAYGDAEDVLGAHSSRFRFVSKAPGLKERGCGPEQILEDLKKSLHRLKTDRLRAFLLHREGDLLEEQGREVWAVLREIRDSGLAEKVGVSSHNPESLSEILRRYPLDIVQIPVSALDRRYFTGPLPDLYRERELELHGRSIFLQGFFFLRPGELTPATRFARLESAALWEEAGRLGMTPARLGMSFALGRRELGGIVFAVTSRDELEDVLSWPVSDIPEDVQLRLEEVSKVSGGRLQDPLRWIAEGN